MVEFMTQETSNTEIKRPSTPLIMDFIHAIDKIKNLDGVINVKVFPTNNNDCMNLYVTVSEESIELNNQIFSSVVHWQEDYSEFIETHIVDKSGIHYIPQGAISL